MRLLITGASGQLGAYLLRVLQRRGHDIIAWSGRQTGELFGTKLEPVDLMNDAATTSAFSRALPDVVIHLAGMTTVAGSYNEPSRARRVNTDATTYLVNLCQECGARFIFTSTDLVFDGQTGAYSEESRPAPLSIYGRSKLAAEHSVLAYAKGVVVRLSLLFGPALNGRPGFFEAQIESLRAARPITLFADEWRTPLALHTAAQALLAMAEADLTGLLHVGGPERLSRVETGEQLAAFLKVNPTTIVAANREAIPAPEPRPRNVSLTSSAWRAKFPHVSWPTFSDALPELAAICRF